MITPFTTLIALVAGLLSGALLNLPLGDFELIKWVLSVNEWPELPGLLYQLTLSCGMLCLFIYHRHEWASMLSSLILLLVLRKKPKTLDERIPLYLIVSAAIALGGSTYLQTLTFLHEIPQGWVLGSIVAVGVLLEAVSSYSKRNRGIYDFNIIDAIVIGVGACGFNFPGFGFMVGPLLFALIRHFNFEASLKYTLYLLPLLFCGKGFIPLLSQSEEGAIFEMFGGAHLTLGVYAVSITASSLFFLTRIVQLSAKHGFRRFAVYRLLLGISGAVFLWLKASHFLSWG